MELKHLRATATLACGSGLIALALTGCKADGGRPVAASSPDSPRSSSPASAAPVETTPSAGATSTPSASGGGAGGGGAGGGGAAPVGQGDTPSCMAAELRAVIQAQRTRSTSEAYALLTLTNRTHHSCALPAGWAPIGAGGPNDYTPFPATRTEFPGRGTNITLRAGASAYAGMKWRTGQGCGPTSGIGVAWHSSWIPATYSGLGGVRTSICGSLVLGTLQPVRNGVGFS